MRIRFGTWFGAVWFWRAMGGAVALRVWRDRMIQIDIRCRRRAWGKFRFIQYLLEDWQLYMGPLTVGGWRPSKLDGWLGVVGDIMDHEKTKTAT